MILLVLFIPMAILILMVWVICTDALVMERFEKLEEQTKRLKQDIENDRTGEI